MKREIIITNDGSKTIHIPKWNEQYHSIHGAIQEAKHVYLKHGLDFFMTSEGYTDTAISVLEIGFGTGLNAFLTAINAEALKLNCNYVGVEGFPISKTEMEALNYIENLGNKELFNNIHTASWNENTIISENFQLKKQKKQFLEIYDENEFNIIYFDAFGPRVQPELWTEIIFNSMYKALKPKGVLVTYCAQGDARRAMISAGFTVSKVEGPPGKRHMLRAIKE